MLHRTWSRGATCALALGLLLGGRTAPADTVTLKNGGTVQGDLVGFTPTSNVVQLRTAGGALIVFERNAVTQVQRGADPAKKAAATKKPTSKGQLTAQEQAWLSKIRRLVSHLESGDSGQARRAKDELLNIHNPAALPALARYLGNSSNVAFRRLFIEILRDNSDARALYALVALSVFDPVPAVREEARGAIGSERADAARGLYIEMLKRRIPGLSSLASQGLAAIGDPSGESVPYLIDNLQYRGTMEVMTRPGRLQIGGGGIECGDAVYSIAFTKSGAMVTLPYGVLKGDSPDSYLHYVASKSGTVEIDEPNAAVLDSLVKITGQAPPGFGYRRAPWCRWWETEKLNRQGGAPRAAGAVRSSDPTRRSLQPEVKDQVR
jgi:hypothetical protein